MTTLTADELDTLAEHLGHEPSLPLLTWLEETVTAHREQAVAEASLAAVGATRHGGGGDFGCWEYGA